MRFSFPTIDVIVQNRGFVATFLFDVILGWVSNVHLFSPSLMILMVLCRSLKLNVGVFFSYSIFRAFLSCRGNEWTPPFFTNQNQKPTVVSGECVGKCNSIRERVDSKLLGSMVYRNQNLVASHSHQFSSYLIFSYILMSKESLGSNVKVSRSYNTAGKRYLVDQPKTTLSGSIP